MTSVEVAKEVCEAKEHVTVPVAQLEPQGVCWTHAVRCIILDQLIKLEMLVVYRPLSDVAVVKSIDNFLRTPAFRQCSAPATTLSGPGSMHMQRQLHGRACGQ